MNTIHSKKRSRLLLADLAAWEKENGEDNALRLERLRRNLRQARRQELTERQQQVLTLFFDRQMNMTEIAAELGIHRSTVSRTLHRAMDRLQRALRYAL